MFNKATIFHNDTSDIMTSALCVFSPVMCLIITEGTLPPSETLSYRMLWARSWLGRNVSSLGVTKSPGNNFMSFFIHFRKYSKPKMKQNMILKNIDWIILTSKSMHHCIRYTAVQWLNGINSHLIVVVHAGQVSPALVSSDFNEALNKERKQALNSMWNTTGHHPKVTVGSLNT